MGLVEQAKVEGNYQDIIINGQIISKGWRECESRWQIIRPHVKNQQTIMDIGSHYGYFTTKITTEYPDTLVWSIEENTSRATIQRQVLEANKLNNVVLSKTSIKLIDMLKLQRTCESLDTIIALSVIHYFPLKSIPEIVWAFSRLAQNLIIEFPSVEEQNVANKNIVDALEPEYLLGLVYKSVIKIGETPSPKHPKIMRPIYLAQNYEITRENCMSYWNSKSGGQHTVKYKNLQWFISKSPKEYNGLNLANLSYFKVIYPNPKKWFKEASDRYINIINQVGAITDIHPRNIIISHNGVFPIDYSESIGQPVYNLEWEAYQKRILNLSVKEIQEQLAMLYKTGALLPVGAVK